MEEDKLKTLSILKEIQELDEKINSINEVVGEIPGEISNIKNIINDLDLKKQKIKKNIEMYDNIINENNANIKESQEQIEQCKLESKEVNNERNYTLLMKKMKLAEYNIILYNQVISKNTGLKNGNVEKLNKIQASIDEYNKNLQEYLSIFNKINSLNKSQLDELYKNKEQFLTVLPTTVFNLYEKIKEMYNNEDKCVFANVVDGFCSGCGLQVNVSTRLNVQKQSTIEQSEMCYRILLNVINSSNISH